MESIIRLTEQDTIDTLFDQEKEVEIIQDYYTYRIIMGLRTYGHDRIDAILERCPNFDINHKIYGVNIGMPYCEHLNDISVVKREANNTLYTDIADNRFSGTITTDEFGMIRFFGGVVQYAILKNDLDLVQHLYDLGANVKFENPNGFDATREYINSSEMMQLVSKLNNKRRGRTYKGKSRRR